MMKFEDYKKEFLLFLELERGYSEQTIDTYKRGIDRYLLFICLLYTSPSPRDQRGSRMPSSA